MHRLDGAATLHPGMGALRGVRAVMAGTMCSVTAWVAHAVAGGSVPIAVGWLMLVAASTMAWLLASRRLTTGQLVGLLILCQAFTHLACATQANAPMGAFMVSVHVLATGLSAAALRYGEQWLWRASEFIRTRIRPMAHVVPVPAFRQLQLARLLAVPSQHLRVATPFVRGPPVSVL